MARLTDEERAAMRAACEAAKTLDPASTLALAEAVSVDVMLALLDERDALATEVERLRNLNDGLAGKLLVAAARVTSAEQALREAEDQARAI